jgi:hypothetical protein
MASLDYELVLRDINGLGARAETAEIARFGGSDVASITRKCLRKVQNERLRVAADQ